MSDGPRAASSRVVLAGFFALIAVAVGGFALLYFRLLGYDRVAVRHVPASAVVAARVDLRQVVLFAPLREHVVPVLARALAPGEAETSSLRRIEEATGVNLGMDVFEVAVVQAEQGLGVVIGGRLPRDGVVRGIAELVASAGARTCRLEAERLACDAPRVFVEQAEDGAVVAATDPRLLDEMLPDSEAHAAIGLDAEPAGSFAFAASRLPVLGAAGVLAPLDLSRLERVEGRLELQDPVVLHLEAVPKAGASLSDWPEKLASLQAASALFALAPGGDFGGERAVFSRLTFGARENRATADASWERHEIDQAAKSLGAWLGRWLGHRS